VFSAATKTILLTCLLAVVSTAQTGRAFRSNVEIVVVPFTVVDTDGVAVAGLTREEFQIYDNDVRRPIESFWVDNDLPLTLGLVIDASESQKAQILEHRQTAIDLLQQILRPADRAFVISVDENVKMWVDLTASSARIRGNGEKPCRAIWRSLPAARECVIRRQSDIDLRIEPALECDL